MMKSNLLIFFFFLAYCLLCPKKLCQPPGHKDILLYFVLKLDGFSFYVQVMSMIHLEFIFCWWYEVKTSFIFFHINIQLFQHHLLK